MLSIQLVNTAGAVSDVLPEYWEYFSEPTASSEVVPVIGIKSQSDEYNKVTLMSDGSYTHEISVDPIAFYDESNELQFIDCACRMTERISHEGEEGFSKRAETKRLIKALRETNPFVEKNIFRSVENVHIDTVISYKTKGVRHHFLDTYDE